jgi:hypothetical protein
LWLAEAQRPNLPEPLSLDVTGDWPASAFDGVFSANTAHIMGLPEVGRSRSTIGRWFGTGAARQDRQRIRQRGLRSGAAAARPGSMQVPRANRRLCSDGRRGPMRSWGRPWSPASIRRRVSAR